MKILLLGKDGQLGWELQRALAPLGELVALGRAGGEGLCGDLSRPQALVESVRALAPDLIVNAAAHTAVDKAESEPALAHAINAEAVAALAAEAAASDAWLVHYSTDYVFDGSGAHAWREDDPTGPLGVYGASKLAGEQAVREGGAAHKIFRLCWVYGPRGHNFLLTMLRLARERGHLRVVDDQHGTPTAVPRIAAAVAGALRNGPDRMGTWHLAAGGESSWHGFADAIFEAAVARGLLAAAPVLEAVPSEAYPTRARRPAWSVLDTSAFTRDFGLHIGHWREGLDEVLASLASEGGRP